MLVSETCKRVWHLPCKRPMQPTSIQPKTEVGLHDSVFLQCSVCRSLADTQWNRAFRARWVDWCPPAYRNSVALPRRRSQMCGLGPCCLSKAEPRSCVKVEGGGGGASWVPVPNKPMFSVDVKQHFNNNLLSAPCGRPPFHPGNHSVSFFARLIWASRACSQRSREPIVALPVRKEKKKTSW